MSELWTDEQARWTVTQMAALAKAGCEPVGPTVLPNAKFFPDKFDKTPDAVHRLFGRLKTHVGLDDIPTEVLLVDDQEGRVVSSCSGGSCSTGGVKTLAGQRIAVREDGSYAVLIAVSEITHPVVLTTAMSRAIGLLFMELSGVMTNFTQAELPAVADVAASMLGLGVMIANGSGIEVKGCGGMKVHAATSVTGPVAVLTLALVEERRALRGADNESTAEGESLASGLDPVARSLMGVAQRFAHANREVVRRMDDSPASLERGDFRLKSGESVTDRLFRKLGWGKKDALDPIEALQQAALAGELGPKKEARKTSAKERARVEELSDLYDQATKG